MFDDYEEYENNDRILEFMNEPLDLELAIAEYVTHANLDKLKTNDLISLLNMVHDQEKSPPASSLILWNRLNIKFNYYTIEYCTSCMFKRLQCSCSFKEKNKLIPSELIVFPIREEIARVIKTNYSIIMDYKSKNNCYDDIIHGIVPYSFFSIISG